MSTMMVTAEDYAFYDFLAPLRWPEKTPQEILELRKLVDTGELHLETVLENALAVQSDGAYSRNAITGQDFCDGIDAKKTSSQFRNNKPRIWTNSCFVTNIKNKTGLLRVLCYSKQQSKFYFFAIPYSAYKNISVLEIIMDSFCGYQGTPLGIPKGKWAKYQVDSFKKLATITEQEAEGLPKLYDLFNQALTNTDVIFA